MLRALSPVQCFQASQSNSGHKFRQVESDIYRLLQSDFRKLLSYQEFLFSNGNFHNLTAFVTVF